MKLTSKSKSQNSLQREWGKPHWKHIQDLQTGSDCLKWRCWYHHRIALEVCIKQNTPEYIHLYWWDIRNKMIFFLICKISIKQFWKHSTMKWIGACFHNFSGYPKLTPAEADHKKGVEVIQKLVALTGHHVNRTEATTALLLRSPPIFYSGSQTGSILLVHNAWNSYGFPWPTFYLIIWLKESSVEVWKKNLQTVFHALSSRVSVHQHRCVNKQNSLSP